MFEILICLVVIFIFFCKGFFVFVKWLIICFGILILGIYLLINVVFLVDFSKNILVKIGLLLLIVIWFINFFSLLKLEINWFWKNWDFVNNLSLNCFFNFD